MRILAPILLAAYCTVCLAADPPANATAGILTGPNGMTLYTFTNDPVGSGKSVCNGPCAALWPPLAASASDKGSGEYSVIARDDGSRQWAYKGKPLYFWVRDVKSGDKTGDGVNNVWHLARP